jgi:chromosome partitioning protein
MNAKVIGIIQVKGGAGRSTLSTNLAGELSKIGKTVLIDADMPQGTSASWFSLREQAGRAGELSVATAADHHQLIERVEELRVGAEFIVLDGPPRIAEMTRASLMLSDLCLLPVGASLAEIWATADVLSLIEQARKVRPVDARMIWTRHRSRTKLAEEVDAQAEEGLGLPILKVAMGLASPTSRALGPA